MPAWRIPARKAKRLSLMRVVVWLADRARGHATRKRLTSHVRTSSVERYGCSKRSSSSRISAIPCLRCARSRSVAS